MSRNGKGLTGTELFWAALGEEAGREGAKQKFECQEKRCLRLLYRRWLAHLHFATLAAYRTPRAQSPTRSANEEEPCPTVCRCVSKLEQQPHDGTRGSKTGGVATRLSKAKEYHCARDDSGADTGRRDGSSARGLRPALMEPIPQERTRPVLFARSRRVRRRGDVRVDKPFMSGVSRSVAIPIRGVGGRAVCRAFFAAGALRKLPHLGRKAALRYGWDVRKDASRRGRADIVENPENKLTTAEMILQILCRDDCVALAFVDRDGGTVGATLEV